VMQYHSIGIPGFIVLLQIIDHNVYCAGVEMV
jgi:hypothetical protein